MRFFASLRMTKLGIILDFIPLRGTLAEPTKRKLSRVKLRAVWLRLGEGTIIQKEVLQTRTSFINIGKFIYTCCANVCSFTTLRLTFLVAVLGKGSFRTTIFTGLLYGANCTDKFLTS